MTPLFHCSVTCGGQETALSIRFPIERFYPLGKVCLTVGRRSRALCHALFSTHLYFEGNFDMKNAEPGIFSNVSVAHLLLIIWFEGWQSRGYLIAKCVTDNKGGTGTCWYEHGGRTERES